MTSTRNSTWSMAAVICCHQSRPPSMPSRSRQSGTLAASRRSRSCAAKASPSLRAYDRKTRGRVSGRVSVFIDSLLLKAARSSGRGNAAIIRAMQPQLATLDHIHVSVADRTAAEAWYRRVLHLERVERLAFWTADHGPLTLA